MEDLPERLAASGATQIRGRLASLSGGEVLDVATGTGDFIDTLMKTLKSYESFIGIDISKKDLASAQKRFADQPVKLLEMNAESLQWDDNAFDTISMAHSIHHLQQPDKVLAEMHRVLKPGGHLILEEEFRDGKQTEAQRTNLLQHAWEAQIDSLLGETHHKSFTKTRISALVRTLPLDHLEIFESTHPVECLNCERRFTCDPKSEAEIQRSLQEIEDNLKRLEKVANPKLRVKLQKMSETLKTRTRKFGNAHPSIVLAIGRKT